MMRTDSTITFEHPVNETSRVSLRLEYLQQRATYFLYGTHPMDSMMCLSALIDMLNVLDRPDLRSKLSQEISRIKSNMKRLSQTPNIDQERLGNTITGLEAASKQLHAETGRFAGRLRQNDFIESIRQHHTTPGGTCCTYNTPSFHLWLQHNPEQRTHQLQAWLQEFEDVLNITKLLLSLIRDCSSAIVKVANAGFYHSTLNPLSPCQLLQIEVNTEYQAYPQVSAGRHGLSIRFLKSSLETKAEQTGENIEFLLNTCVL